MWDYRGVKRVIDGEATYAIHECYYDENGVPKGITEDPSFPVEDTLEGLSKDLELYSAALNREVLNWEDF